MCRLNEYYLTSNIFYKIEYERFKLRLVTCDDEEVERLIKIVDSSKHTFTYIAELEYLTIIREILINGIDSKLINSIDDINNFSKIIKIYIYKYKKQSYKN